MIIIDKTFSCTPSDLRAQYELERIPMNFIKCTVSDF